MDAQAPSETRESQISLVGLLGEVEVLIETTRFVVDGDPTTRDFAWRQAFGLCDRLVSSVRNRRWVWPCPTLTGDSEVDTLKYCVWLQQLAYCDLPPSFDEFDLAILRALHKSPTRLRQDQLVSRLRGSMTPLSLRNIGPRLHGLRRAGFTWQPKGPRSGEAITEQGRAFLEACAAAVARS